MNAIGRYLLPDHGECLLVAKWVCCHMTMNAIGGFGLPDHGDKCRMVAKCSRCHMSMMKAAMTRSMTMDAGGQWRRRWIVWLFVFPFVRVLVPTTVCRSASAHSPKNPATAYEHHL